MVSAGPGVLLAVLLGAPPVATPTPLAKIVGPAAVQPVQLAGQPGLAVAAAGAFAPRTIRTAPFLVTGTGALAAAPPFTPLDVRTATFTVTGTGALAALPPFTPVDVRTKPFTVAGASALKEKP
jgi:hypothetical protein